MLKHKRRPSAALVISVIALFVALGGGAVAATAITSKDVNNKGNLKNKAVDTNNLAGKAVTAKKLAPGAAKAGKIADGAVSSSKIAPGAVSDLFSFTPVTETVNVPEDTVGTATATCPPGTLAVSGGYDTGVKNAVAALGLGIENGPSNNGWRASVFANNGDNTLTVRVKCLDDTTR